ncbi:MAG: hypothetical protein MI739_01320 [Bacteroidales bacterium]|nr:hypothetical protein [Bacteroidales bacterium]
MTKILRVLLIVLLAISALICLLFYVGGDDVSGDPAFTNLYVGWAYALVGSAVGLSVIFPVIQMITNPKKAKKGLYGIVALAIVIFVAYAIASDELLGIINPELIQYDSPATLKYAGMMLHSIYLLSGLAILSMIYSEIAKLFK